MAHRKAGTLKWLVERTVYEIVELSDQQAHTVWDAQFYVGGRRHGPLDVVLRMASALDIDRERLGQYGYSPLKVRFGAGAKAKGVKKERA